MMEFQDFDMLTATYLSFFLHSFEQKLWANMFFLFEVNTESFYSLELGFAYIEYVFFKWYESSLMNLPFVLYVWMTLHSRF